MASMEGKNTKSKARQNEDTPKTITLSFVPEIERYERPKNKEEYIRTYFESINGINKRIIAEERRIIAQNRNTWPTLPVEERDRLLDDQLISGNARQKYNSNEDCLDKKSSCQAEDLIAPIERTGTTAKHYSSADSSISSQRGSQVDYRSQTTSYRTKDSFSSPFQWRTKSQRNIRFPEVKREKLKNTDVQETQDRKPNKAATKQDKQDGVTKPEENVKKLNNVENSMKEDQIETKNENIKDSVLESNTALPVVTNKQSNETPKTSTNLNESVENQDEISSEQPNVDGKKLLDGSDNIFEFLQSWNP